MSERHDDELDWPVRDDAEPPFTASPPDSPDLRRTSFYSVTHRWTWEPKTQRWYLRDRVGVAQAAVKVERAKEYNEAHPITEAELEHARRLAAEIPDDAFRGRE